MTTDERLEALERRVAQYEDLIARLVMLAAQHPFGRRLLKQMGIRDGVG